MEFIVWAQIMIDFLFLICESFLSCSLILENRCWIHSEFLSREWLREFCEDIRIALFGESTIRYTREYNLRDKWDQIRSREIGCLSLEAKEKQIWRSHQPSGRCRIQIWRAVEGRNWKCENYLLGFYEKLLKFIYF